MIAERSKDLQTVTGELVNAGKGLQIIYTARDRVIHTDPYDCKVIKLGPLSDKILEFGFLKKNQQCEAIF